MPLNLCQTTETASIPQKQDEDAAYLLLQSFPHKKTEIKISIAKTKICGTLTSCEHP